MDNLRGPMMAQRLMQGNTPVMNGTRAPMPMAGAGPMAAPAPIGMLPAPRPPAGGGLGWLGGAAGMGGGMGGPQHAGGFAPVYHAPPATPQAAPNFLRIDDPAFQQMQQVAGSGGPGG